MKMNVTLHSLMLYEFPLSMKQIMFPLFYNFCKLSIIESPKLLLFYENPQVAKQKEEVNKLIMLGGGTKRCVQPNSRLP